MGALIDETGNRYGRLLVIAEAGQNKWSAALWLCVCDCGNESTVNGTSLRSGKTRSCGCYHRERMGDVSRTHGHAGHGDRPDTPTYETWLGIRRRCSNPENPAWKYYGGRGINVCDRWDSFAAFLEDMGERPPDPPDWEGKISYWTIDRIDPSGDYEPANCRWATWQEQNDPARKSAS